MKKSHGVDQEDNSEWFKSYDKDAIYKMYGFLRRIVGQTADVGDTERCKQQIDSAALEGDDV